MADISTRQVSAALRKYVYPVLQQHGFANIKPRAAYRHESTSISIMSFPSIGAYLAKQTGFPSLSLTAVVGIHWPCVPNPFGDDGTYDKDGNPQSAAVHSVLHGDAATQPRKNLTKVEQGRTDTWWIEPDGSNLTSVCNDLTTSVIEQGLPWLERWRTLESALQTSLEEENEYPARTWRIYAIARALGRRDVMDAFREKLQAQWPKHYESLIG
jgi:hypothetical protein